MVNLNVRLDDSEHERLLQACKGRGCDKSALVREALRAYLVSSPSPAKTLPAESKAEPYDVWNTATGCCSRHRANGELMFHFQPTEVKDGVQYYRDTMSDNPERKWQYSKERGWVQMISLY